ncbi:hypothetical protein KIW84_066020 [Lathyrus oleraceus]|uniref:NAA35-like N-terminal domain-containing protein n=1 Tax=Pisum sativum TaxID=3888 RepID=A0A9D4WEI3_PEA|nr:hypothetical protein KIW84_066020 [Pisum sativum]
MAALDCANEQQTPIQLRPHIPSSDNSAWADVSPLLHAACQDIQEGDLIHGDNFNLYVVMSALEIMDPKMDSGMDSTYYSLDEAIENGVAPVPISVDKTTDVQCIIGIMDHLLACEAKWHKGHSLTQTIYSCLYLLRPERTSSHALLHSYFQVIRATYKEVLSAVADARTHEEEALFVMAYGLPLSGDGKERVSEDIEPLQNNPDLEEGYCKALLFELRFPKHFYHLLMSMKRPQGGGLELVSRGRDVRAGGASGVVAVTVLTVMVEKKVVGAMAVSGGWVCGVGLNGRVV